MDFFVKNQRYMTDKNNLKCLLLIKVKLVKRQLLLRLTVILSLLVKCFNKSNENSDPTFAFKGEIEDTRVT